MTDHQLYIAVGLPTVTALIGILVNIGYFVVINGRLTSLETRVSALGERMAVVETSLAFLREGFTILNAKLDELEKKR